MPQHGRALMAGGFSRVSSDLNKTPSALDKCTIGCRWGLLLVKMTYGIADVWREQPGKRASDPSETRLDRLIVLDVVDVAKQSGIWDGLPEDHLAVTLRLQAPSELCRGPPT